MVWEYWCEVARSSRSLTQKSRGTLIGVLRNSRLSPRQKTKSRYRRIAAVRKSGVEMDYPSGWNDLTPELLDAIGAIRKLGGTINRVFGEAGEDTVEISFLGNAQINDDHLIASGIFPG